ncbi:MAG TPA: NAD-glutamate dehydrogenase [Stellaceae bacterium]|nr:NAD-glutamate dehydrogenase [Stellaceae bacterium]
MPHDADSEKQAQIDRLVAGRAAIAVGPDVRFLREFYRNVAAEDLQSRSVDDLLAAADSIWSFLGQRRPGRASIRVIEAPRWSPRRAVIEIVNDDMPFLVDSVTACLAGHELGCHLVIHPIVAVERDAEGHLSAFGAGLRESVMQIELASRIDAEAAGEIVRDLEAVLADVRVAVLDWAAMRRKVSQLADALGDGTAPVPPVEITETSAFLVWLTENNFTFLGYREYALSGEGMEVVPGAGKGILRDDSYLVFEGIRNFGQVSPDVQQFLRSPRLMMIAKSSRRSTVHRPAQLDTVAIKSFDADGKVTGQRLIVGLFTSASYAAAATSIPVIGRKVARCIARAGFPPDSHDGKALQHILDTFPRDELFQIDEQDLFPIALGVLHLQERRRIALFVRRDPFARFVSCLVYVPRERYSEQVRNRFAGILRRAFSGVVTGEATQLDESSVLARIHFTVATPHGHSEIDLAEVERELVEAGGVWADRLGEALVRAHGEEVGPSLLRRFADAFPSGYTERTSPEASVGDIDRILAVEAGTAVALTLDRDPAGAAEELRLKTFHAKEPIALSDVLPILEDLGLRVITEIPFDCRPRGGGARICIQEFSLVPHDGHPIDLDVSAARFEEAFPQIWSGGLESDGFNRLILGAGLSSRQVVILRTYSKLMRQAGSAFSQAYMEDTLGRHPDVARALVALFESQFDPALSGDREAKSARIEAAIRAELDAVSNLDEDRILRGFLLLVLKTLRTNYYQRDAGGEPKPYLSVKLASREIDLLPLPRPLYEIFVYAPRMEGCHLRGGRVARGGIRWSDRKEDFRTEILGLMKAQMVKNAVIVPVGSKGGFVVKRPPAGREALMAEVVACYKMLMSGLLDITDTIAGDAVVPPPDVVRRDADDPYLVVAADKGTATFSDIANGVAHDYGFWLDDAFASGGSVGYDHKAMGITARGAWEAVKRHFREIGSDIQTTDFTCVGVGDMSGDVFGNGMLLSRHTKLIAAFDHRHIFIDPDPDAERSWAERKRLFELPRSSWNDYDREMLSAGGGIYERSLKAVRLSPEAQARLGLGPDALSPAQLIQALLKQKVDLLWFGGIGTYVKASAETHADVGDRANDALRVDAPALRAAVIGEGANLGVTQRGRIEYALRGGRLNTDAIDNSAGVDTSDHEVNIKIGIGGIITAGQLAAADRSRFLGEMTDEVGLLVLRDNYLQTQALTLAESQASRELDQQVRLMRALERAGRLDRAIEFLPDDETLEQRAVAKRGLTRPELAVLLAYAKNALYDELLESDLPDAPEFEDDLIDYFPSQMRTLAPDVLTTHRLRREIIATCIANQMINRMGPTFLAETQANTGRDAADIARAFRIACDVFDLPDIWQDIESLDNRIPAQAQTRMLVEVREVAERAVDWLLSARVRLTIGARTRQFRPGVRKLAARLPDLLPSAERRGFEQRKARFLEAGVEEALAHRVVALANLAAGLDIIRLDEGTELDVVDLGKLYYDTGECFGLDTLRDYAREMTTSNSWQRLAVAAVLQDFYRAQSGIAELVIRESGNAAAPSLDAWVAARPDTVIRLQEMVAEIGRAPARDIAMLTVAARQLHALAG